jgi:S-adenosylmethionine:tRNA ribosyltransferase-isomerase
MAATSVEDPFFLEATEPPEARGLSRDAVRLLVSDVERDTIEHARFRDLPQFLAPGDLLVVNTSGTLNAALTASTDSGELFELHLSTQLPGGFWTVELRARGPVASLPYWSAHAGLTLHLPAGGRATLLAPYPARERHDRTQRSQRTQSKTGFLCGLRGLCVPRLRQSAGQAHGDALDSQSRLWLAVIRLPGPADPYLERHGFPIRYSYVPEPWPGSMYQTMFATEPGSAEMPSAGRPFTPDLIARLMARGIQIAPLLLHTGVASLEDHEPPYEEFYRVPRETAERVNAARLDGHRVVAVGTTVVRALETVTDDRGSAHPGEGWTSLVVTPERPLRCVNALITGLHEPRATHLAILAAVVTAAHRHTSRINSALQRHGLPGTGPSKYFPPQAHLDRAYAEARREGYLWHEFGDSHLLR